MTPQVLTMDHIFSILATECGRSGGGPKRIKTKTGMELSVYVDLCPV